MQLHEYGAEQKETILLLHGGGLSWWNYRQAAEKLQEDYHVILPILDGHAGSDRPFTTIEDNASELIAFIDERLGGSVLLIGGLSLGGQILLEMLSQRGDICRHALAESAMAVPSGLTAALIRPSLACSFRLIRSRGFARLQFRSLRMPPELFEEYYRDTCAISRTDMTAFLTASTSYRLKESFEACRAKVHVFAGEKETRGILRSARLIHEKAPGSGLTVLPGLYHGGFSLWQPEEYVRRIESLALFREVMEDV